MLASLCNPRLPPQKSLTVWRQLFYPNYSMFISFNFVLLVTSSYFIIRNGMWSYICTKIWWRGFSCMWPRCLKLSTLFSEYLLWLHGGNADSSNCFMNISYQSVPQNGWMLLCIMVPQDNPFLLHYFKLKYELLLRARHRWCTDWIW